MYVFDNGKVLQKETNDTSILRIRQTSGKCILFMKIVFINVFATFFDEEAQHQMSSYLIIRTEYEQDPYMNNILNCTRNLVIPLVYLVNVVDLDIFESKKWVLILLAIFRQCGHEGIRTGSSVFIGKTVIFKSE